MTKTSLSIDREKADAAATVLGTTTLTATIDAALTEIVNMDRRRRLVERMRRSDGESARPTPNCGASGRRERRVPRRHERLESQQRDAGGGGALD